MAYKLIGEKEALHCLMQVTSMKLSAKNATLLALLLFKIAQDCHNQW